MAKPLSLRIRHLLLKLMGETCFIPTTYSPQLQKIGEVVEVFGGHYRVTRIIKNGELLTLSEVKIPLYEVWGRKIG